MKSTLTVQVPVDLADWLQGQSKDSGMSADQLISLYLSVARAREIAGTPYESLAGAAKGTPLNLSTQKPFKPIQS